MMKVAILDKVKSRITASHEDKEGAVFIAFLIGLGGLFPSIAVVIMADSVTVLSDLLKNISLVFAMFLSWIAVRRAAQGNPNYNYGFGKLENLSSLMVAAMMIVSFAIILFQTVGRLRDPVAIHGVGVGMGVLFSGLSIFINAWMWRKDRQLARKQQSPVLESLWRLHRIKTVSTMCVFFPLLLSLALKNYPWVGYIDPVGSIILLGFLGFSVYGVVSMSVYDLLDRTLEESLQLVILRELAVYFDRYVDIHGVRSRRSGSHVFIEIFLEFDGDQKMAEVQEVIDLIKSDLEGKIPNSRVFVVPATSPVC